MLQLLVHPFQLGAYGEYNLHALLLRHFRVVHTHLPDVVHDFHASQYQVTVNLVPPGCQCHGKSPFSVLPKLLRQVSHVVRQPSYLVVEAIDLCRIAHDIPERIKIVVECPLQIGRAFHFFPHPEMSGCLHQHRLFLAF